MPAARSAITLMLITIFRSFRTSGLHGELRDAQVPIVGSCLIVDNPFDRARGGWQAAHMTYGIETHPTL